MVSFFDVTNRLLVIYPVRVDYWIGFAKVNKSLNSSYKLIKEKPETIWTGIYNLRADYLNKYTVCAAKIIVNDAIILFLSAFEIT